MIELRGGRVDDIDDVLALWARAEAEPTVTDDESALRVLLRHARESLLLAVDDGSVIGSLIVGWDGWRGTFYRLAVEPSRRRQGVARQLVDAGEAQLSALGARRLALFAVEGDPAAVPFWEAVGYEAQTDRQRLFENLASA